MTWLYIFILFGFAGWLLELVFRSWDKGGPALNEFHWRLPFLPIYGFGALYLVGLQPTFQSLPFFGRGLIYALALTAIEFTCGIGTELFFKKRFWDYSKKPFNLYGHIDLETFFYWFALGMAFEALLFPAGLKLLAFLRLV